jgi:putative DNA primase/helicase
MDLLAVKSPVDLILAGRDGAVPNDVAALRGVRMTVTAEIEQGKKLDESKVKDLTGGDTLTARFMHRDFFSFQPTHKLWVYGNHKPSIRGTDKGICSRQG